MSPSLKCDSLLDHKIKSNLIADLLTLVDVGCRQAGQVYREDNEKLKSSYGQQPINPSAVDSTLLTEKKLE